MMEKLVSVRGLKKYFRIASEKLRGAPSYVRAVDDVSFDVYKGETLGIVGESGCGKSTLGKTMLCLYPPTEGRVLYRDLDLFTLGKHELKTMRRYFQMIFQDPCSSLNPRKRVRSLLEQPFLIHKLKKKQEIDEQIDALLQEVGLSSIYKKRYPHQFSGGQRQRIGIARAIALKPELIICDEAVSALDVSIQAQILNLLKDLQQKYRLTYVFIAHDLSVVEFISDRIMVMYLGKIVELTSRKVLMEKPLHPYTQALFAACPRIDLQRRKTKKNIVLGDVPSPIDPPKGCHFHPRCSHRMDICEERYPAFQEVEEDHFIACHLYASSK